MLQVNPYARIDLKSLMQEVANLTSLTNEGPLASVPKLDDHLYDTFITGDRGMSLREMLKEEDEFEREVEAEVEDGTVSESTPCESDEEWTKSFGNSLFMQWAGNNLSTLTNFSYH